MSDRCGRRAGRPAAGVLLPALLAGALAGALITTAALAEGVEEQKAYGTSIAAEVPAPETNPFQAEWRALAATTIALSGDQLDEAGEANARQLLRCLDPRDGESGGVSRKLVALPECDAATVAAVLAMADGGSRTVLERDGVELARVDEIVRVREQTLALVSVNAAAVRRRMAELGLTGDVEIVVEPVNARSVVGSNAGPFTRVLERTVLNYDAEVLWSPPSSVRSSERGAVTYCYSVTSCAEARIDVLFLVANELFASPVLNSYANYHASYLGLNVGIVAVSALPEVSPEAIHSFIQDVYETQSAAHFGDGHLGFVTLVGDAFADDNQTVMLPSYDGYGGTEVASDHYYACVSGDDDFEDVMIGRQSVGNDTELAIAVGKAVNYMPLPAGEPWRESVLLIGGLFYTLKDEYVALFNEYEELIPDTWNVDRIYRHDFESKHECSLAVVDEFNQGHLIVDFAGDGWISVWDRTLDTSDIPEMSNADRLPIVLSMACMTGWFDNTTEIDQLGSYDCLAEQMVNTSGRGAVACLAAPRASDGGMYRTLTKKIYNAVFDEGCVFIGETVAVAKLLHLQDGGDVDYARHFNLFGDPALLYRWDVAPNTAPELLVRPYEVTMNPQLPASGDDLTLTISLRNQSSIPTTDVIVRVSDVSAAGSYSRDLTVPSIAGWSVETVTTVLQSLSDAWHIIGVTVDPENDIAEIDESNNSFSLELYAYPHIQGFPATSGAGSFGPRVARLASSEPHVLTMESEARVRLLDAGGQTVWVSDPATSPVDYGPEVAPAIGDIDGDGASEVIATRRMGLLALDADGGVVWDIITDDPVGSPVLADADGDGDLDVLVATRSFFGGNSNIVAIDESGTPVWAYSLPSGDPASATPVVGDFDQDGVVDFAYGTSLGLVGAVTCATFPPSDLWQPVAVSPSEISALGLADLDDDGVLEVAAIGAAAYSLNAEDGTNGWTVPLPAAGVALALGDVHGDGVADVLVGTDDGTLQLIEGGSVIWSSDLSSMPCASLSVADVRSDAEMEILAVTEDGFVHVLDSDGDWVMQPMPIPGDVCSPFVADLTADGAVDVCVSSSDGLVFAFEMSGASDEAALEWRGLGGNVAHTGVLVQPFAGSFSADAVLNGRYAILGDVTVEPGVTLSILPESVLEFDSDVSPRLIVRGGLSAAGNAGAEVVMRAEPDRDFAVWGGIDARPGGSVDMSHCLISDAAIGINGNQADVSVSDCIIQGNTYGAYLEGCSVDALSSSFSFADSSGMYALGGSGTIEGCLFEGNHNSGLTCYGSASHNIVGSTFTGTTDGDGLVCSRFSNVEVDSCTITYNEGHGILAKNASPRISGCTILENGGNGIHCLKLAAPVITWCTIADNRIGVVAETGAAPDMGNGVDPAQGMNSVMNNQQAAVANYTDSEFPIETKGNWWGRYPPMGRIFIGYVRFMPCLTAPPGPDGVDPVAIDGVEEPAFYRLGGNAPNPFNPVTSVEFDVPTGGGRIDLSVFDVAGRRVATLYSGYHEPGTHSAAWDGRDERGRQVASGIYFVRLSAHDFRATRKMILLK